MTGTTGRITARQFLESDGVEDWRVVGDGACACFRTGSVEEGSQLVRAIGELPDINESRPDVDLRPEAVTVRLVTITANYFGLHEHHVELARQISALARERSFPADPSAVQSFQVTIDALISVEVMPFWRAVLAYDYRGDTPDEDLIDPRRRGPSIWFQRMDAPRPQRNRIHVDLWVPYDQAEARVAAAIAAGGHLVSDAHAPEWWTLADAEGNEVDIATIMGRD